MVREWVAKRLRRAFGFQQDACRRAIERFDAYERGVAPSDALIQVIQQLAETTKAIAETRAGLVAMREDVRVFRSGYDPTRKALKDAHTMHEIFEDQGAFKPWRGLGVRCRNRLDSLFRPVQHCRRGSPTISPGDGALDLQLHVDRLMSEWRPPGRLPDTVSPPVSRSRLAHYDATLSTTKSMNARTFAGGRCREG
jgi:hypothetical protein